MQLPRAEEVETETRRQTNRDTQTDKQIYILTERNKLVNAGEEELQLPRVVEVERDQQRDT